MGQLFRIIADGYEMHAVGYSKQDVIELCFKNFDYEHLNIESTGICEPEDVTPYFCL